MLTLKNSNCCVMRNSSWQYKEFMKVTRFFLCEDIWCILHASISAHEFAMFLFLPLHALTHHELHIVDYSKEKQYSNSWNEYIKWMPNLRLFNYYRTCKSNCKDSVDVDRSIKYATTMEEQEARREVFHDINKVLEIEIKFRQSLQFKTIEVFAFYDLELSLLKKLTFDELEELKFSFHLKFNSVGSSFFYIFYLDIKHWTN